jgi:hypothetical protein
MHAESGEKVKFAPGHEPSLNSKDGPLTDPESADQQPDV